MLDTLRMWIGAPGAITALITLVGFLLFKPMKKCYIRLRDRYRRRRSNLLKLACGLTFDGVEALVGKPITKRAPSNGSQRVTFIYRTREVYVAATAPSKDDSIDAFAITVRRRGFRLPVTKLLTKQMKLALPRTRFAALQDHPDSIRYIVGASRFGYSEEYYFGRPGLYQHYIVAYNDAGIGKVKAPLQLDSFASGFLRLEEDEHLPEEPTGSWLRTFRSAVKPNTLAVVGGAAPSLSIIMNHQSVGVDQSDVSSIPE
ncbi:hypothetical protein NLX83_01650 [Allokutzneria sp. A3M-2-11 16]|uniref:ETEC_3214 domain-containing protein n=1 Tax=Allokutzneria sp. A3M-2-11 16 TaxID=2962043 RepID=UPI0020B80ABA|nr:ETEC_3214 domain-containing protein [Allokutzneria sp. A3M-2-11 16]MCP3797953.1 hypothetical protein [Allokutzneria sp. A3M-2-11 16]